MTQLRPEEVYETIKSVLKNDGLAKMSPQELASFLGKVTRAIYVMPNLAMNTNNQEMKTLCEQVTAIVGKMTTEQVPINQLADFVNATNRFKLRNNQL
jgi:hypothetical protein